ncbi:MAG: hypothetical protein H6729_10985 [Deltaproteobacteria bacterium]|nr:hypothetical protein [Deltaproteobacteria bacterium]
MPIARGMNSVGLGDVNGSSGTPRDYAGTTREPSVRADYAVSGEERRASSAEALADRAMPRRPEFEGGAAFHRGTERTRIDRLRARVEGRVPSLGNSSSLQEGAARYARATLGDKPLVNADVETKAEAKSWHPGYLERIEVALNDPEKTRAGRLSDGVRLAIAPSIHDAEKQGARPEVEAMLSGAAKGLGAMVGLVDPPTDGAELYGAGLVEIVSSSAVVGVGTRAGATLVANGAQTLQATRRAGRLGTRLGEDVAKHTYTWVKAHLVEDAKRGRPMAIAIMAMTGFEAGRCGAAVSQGDLQGAVGAVGAILGSKYVYMAWNYREALKSGVNVLREDPELRKVAGRLVKWSAKNVLRSTQSYVLKDRPGIAKFYAEDVPALRRLRRSRRRND